MIFLRALLSIILLFSAINVMAHSSFIEHGEDIVAVFGFEHNIKIFNRSKDKSNKSWVKIISKDMIDKVDFHKQLEEKYPNLKLAGPNYHRLLFHWGYQAAPWSSALERHIRKYCRDYNLNADDIIISIKNDVKNEQKRRNREMNEVTENVFGFAHGGRDASYANFFITMAYNIHLLGDQQTDNKNFTGVESVENLIGQFVISLRKFDSVESKSIIQGITKINNEYTNSHEKADALMEYFKRTVPTLIKRAQNGSIARRLESNGIKLK